MKPVKQVTITEQRGRWASELGDPGKGHGVCRLPEASQGLALRPSERVGGQQHLPSHVHPLHTLERGPGSLVYRLWGSREPCTKM